MDAADETAGVDVGPVGDGAGVENDEVGGGGIAHGEVAVVGEGGFHGGAVGLGGTAAEALDENALHVSREADSSRQQGGHFHRLAREVQRLIFKIALDAGEPGVQFI